MEQTTYNIFDLGFNKLITRESPLLSGGADLGMASSLGHVFFGGSPSNLSSGELIGNLIIKDGFLQSSNYEEDVAGWRLTPTESQLPGLTIVGGIIRYNKTSFFDTVNAGYHISPVGFYFGSANDASYMRYNIGTGNIDFVGEVSGRSTSTIASAINSDGNFVKEVINEKLDTSSKEILGDFTFGESGAIKMITDANNGIWISPTGILGKKAGNTTFSLGITGNATFAGTLSAASGTLGTITSANITSGTFQTATSGQRIVVNGSNNTITFYDSEGTNRGTIYGITQGIGFTGNLYSSSCDIFAYRLYVNAGSGSGVEPTWNNSVTCGSSSKRWSNVYSNNGNFSGTITSRDIIPSSDDSYDLGSSTYRFQDIYLTGYIRASYLNLGNSLCMTSSSSSDKLYPEYSNKIDLGKSGNNWSYLYVNYCATNIRPTSTSLNLGDSVYYWNEVNYKTLYDRGCLGVFDDGVELQDGKKVSDIEALEAIKVHPKLKTSYGVPRFDYSTMPKAVYKPAPLATEDVYHEKDEKKLLFKKGEKMGEDAAETTALISIMIGAIKELSSRIKKLEQKYEKD